ncbi:cupin domain-containing protein [candidate division KSB1 bacterium]|nr:cupin domain-containing protein [candidate division KSB1 bacterium]
MKISNLKITLAITLTMSLFSALVVRAQETTNKSGQSQSGHAGHVMLTVGDLKWADGPPSIPAGAQFVVIEGNPANPGPFTMRLKLPDNYKIPAHWHPADEHVTVIAGTFNMGMGDKLDMAKGKELPVGSFAVMPAQTNHFAYTKGETIIQLHGIGPWGINYVNPADDPRKK